MLPDVCDEAKEADQRTGVKRESRELAGGFEKSEQLKILYLAQWFNLQKQLRTKLNTFGKNQITRSGFQRKADFWGFSPEMADDLCFKEREIRPPSPETVFPALRPHPTLKAKIKVETPIFRPIS